MATNNFLISVGDFMNIHKATAGKYIWQVLQTIARYLSDHIHFPQNQNELSSIKKDFYQLASMPNVVGALDCTHIKIESPGNFFRNNIFVYIRMYIV